MSCRAVRPGESQHAVTVQKSRIRLAAALALLLAATPGVAKATTYRYIGGTVTDVVSGEPIAGITVSAGLATPVVTDADGRYQLQFDATGDPGAGFEVEFYDYQHRYFYGCTTPIPSPAASVSGRRNR